MSELEFVRLRKLALVIPLPLEDQTVWEPRKVWTGQELRKYHRKLKDIAAALAKCTQLETVRLLLDRNKSDDLSRGKMKKIMRKDRFYGTAKLLMNIVRAADSTGATLSLGRHQIFETVNHSHDTEPLVPWLLQTSLHEGIVVEREQDPPKDWKQNFDEEYQSWATSRHIPGDKASRLKWEVASLTGEAFLKPKVLQSSLVYGMHPKDLWGVTTDDPDFRLIPECRECYAIFSSREDLEKHLKKNPSHQIPFTSKTYNQLDEYFWKDSWRKCPTCGECFLCLGEWHGHIHEYDHDRATIVPRWTEDNEWWDDRYKELREEGRLDLLGARVA